MDKKTGKQVWNSPRLDQIEMVDTAATSKDMRASESEQGVAMARS